MNKCPHIQLTQDIVDYTLDFATDENLLRSGGIPNNMLDKAAFGFSENSVKTLMPKQLKIRWHDDLENVKWEIEQQGMSDEEWARYIDLSEPIEVEYLKNDEFEEGLYISDGHHRYYAAKILDKPLNVKLEIKANPIEKLAPGIGYDNFHRCLFKQVKKDYGFKEVSKTFLKQFISQVTNKYAKGYIKGWIEKEMGDIVYLSEEEYRILQSIRKTGKIPNASFNEVRKIVKEVLKESVINKDNALEEEILKERLMDVDSDVDMIYDYYFKEDYEKIEKTSSLNGIDFEQEEYNTRFLNSPLAKKANKLNPCRIFINIGSNHYNPTASVIAFGVNENAVNFVNDFDGNLKEAIQELKFQGNKTQSISLENEFTESKIKGSIHHELAHWIDDTLHNKHIGGRADKASESGGGLNKKGLPINADKLEVQGQIHNVVQLKKQYLDVWDTLSFNDLLNLSPTLNLVNRQLNGDIKTKWKRDLLTRMHREGLLGKNMIN